MTLKQWLKHLHVWLVTFPLPIDRCHVWIGKTRSPDSFCIVCDAKKYDEDDGCEEEG
jgi:hypothetical protein